MADPNNPENRVDAPTKDVWCDFCRTFTDHITQEHGAWIALRKSMGQLSVWIVEWRAPDYRSQGIHGVFLWEANAKKTMERMNNSHDENSYHMSKWPIADTHGR